MTEFSGMMCIVHEAFQSEPLCRVETICAHKICRALELQGANGRTRVNLKGLNGRQIYKFINVRFKWVPNLHMCTTKGVNLMQYFSNLSPYQVINPWVIHPLKIHLGMETLHLHKEPSFAQEDVQRFEVASVGTEEDHLRLSHRLSTTKCEEELIHY